MGLEPLFLPTIPQPARNVSSPAWLKEYPHWCLKPNAQGSYIAQCHSAIESAREFARLFKLSKKGIPTDATLESAVAAVERAQKAERELERKRQVQTRKDAEERIQQWIAGQAVSIPYTIDTAFLRIIDGQVQTSRGAIVPLEHVTAVTPLVLSYLREGREYKRNGHTIHLGHYSLDRIDSKGNVYAGCHTFDRAEVERFAVLLSQ